MSAIHENLVNCKKAGRLLLETTEELRNRVLITLAQMLRDQSGLIIAANKRDLDNTSPDDPLYDRILLNEGRIDGIASSLEKIVELKSGIGQELEKKYVASGLTITKVKTPIGLVAIIYESRPNVTIDAFSLCFKTANACALKGSIKSTHSDQALVGVIKNALKSHQIPDDVIYLLPPEREEMHNLLNAKGIVDVCIARGGKGLINYVQENAKIPFIETGAGVVHLYIDKSAHIDNAVKVTMNSKTRRVSVCNALDCLIIHKEVMAAVLEKLAPELLREDVKIFADDESHQYLSSIYPEAMLGNALREHYGNEFLSKTLAIKIVPGIDDAMAHIEKYTSSHTEAIMAEDADAINRFISVVDAASVQINASTAFTDGGEFGLGAEIGISTQKLHARGPMGIDALTSYKWVVYGNGQLRK